ncbi:ribonuclease H-like domain-containing protein [Tanacetum coccineum]|uniref:Ribonuclease H-like domain-containing protein n=1 Tax=Tanacetum coccineum TaxID=301880 RepID=A0ABQ5GCF6_9ASTR
MSPRAVLLKTGLTVLNTVRPVNTAHPKSAVPSAKSMSHFSKQAQSTSRRPIYKQTALTRRSVHTAKRHYYTKRPRAVNTASGCSRHITGNIAYLLDFKEFDGGYVAFGGGAYGGRITGKGTLKTDSLDFEDILLKIPRKDNMYSFDMKNIVPKESLTCLIAKATLDESMLWHRRLGKQQQASCKSKVLNPITKSFVLLHMDLLVQPFEILKNFIKEIENLVDKKVKIIRSDNGTEFKNKVMDDFCREKGIKREYSVARTPQQNGVAERRNRTLIEAARTMLADSKLPTTFWAEAVSTACYV